MCSENELNIEEIKKSPMYRFLVVANLVKEVEKLRVRIQELLTTPK